jgi:hypothetical protein
VVKAEISVSWLPWLPMRVIVSRVARHLGCTSEDAWLRIVQVGETRRIKACGLTDEGWPTSPLSASWRGATSDWNIGRLSYDAGELSPRLRLVGSRPARPVKRNVVINDVELCVGDLVEADLLTTTALGRAWWMAAEALAWIIMGVPLAWMEWAGLPELGSGMAQAGEKLARAIGEDQVRAQGRLSPQGPMESLPSSDLRIPGFRWRVGPDGDLGTSPPGRLAVFQGRRWYGIEVDAASLRQAFPKPLRVERWPLIEAQQLYGEGEPGSVSPVEPVAPDSSLTDIESAATLESELARAEFTRWQREPTIEAMKDFYPPHGLRPKGVSIAALTNRINKRPEFKENQVSEDTVRLADKEIKASQKIIP